MDHLKLSEKKILAATESWIKNQAGVDAKKLAHWPQIVFTGKKPVRVIHQNQVYLITPHMCLVLRSEATSLLIKDEGAKLFLSSGKTVNNLRQGLIEISPIMKELLNYTVEIGFLHAKDKEHLSIYRLLTYQLIKSQGAVLKVPVPRDERAFRLYQLLVKENHLDRNLEDLSKMCGASSRTLERLLNIEIGMNFSRWRQLIRVQKALLLLGDGVSVTEVAIELGYSSSSAFIHAFKAQMGLSPKQYINKNK